MIHLLFFLVSVTSLSTHDPSGLSYVNNKWFIYATGNNLQFSSSPDLKTWSTTVVFTSGVPSWIKTAVPGNDGSLWAPDILYFNNTYHLYYAASTFGSQTSCIGLATTTDLNGNHWTDEGSAVCSGAGKKLIIMQLILMFSLMELMVVPYGWFLDHFGLVLK